MSTDQSLHERTARDPASSARYAPSTFLRWLLVTLSCGAGAVHLVMVPPHAQESLVMGLAFAAAGWFQIGFALAVLVAPTRVWLWLAVAANLVFLTAWATSRTVGLPDWTGDGGTRQARSADILCVVFEVAIVVGAVALLVESRVLERWKSAAPAVAVAVAVGVLAGTTAVLVSPSTANHAHASGDEHAHPTTATAHGHDASDPSAATGHDHTESTITYDKLPAATKAEVDQVIALWANKYPTAADAASDGWFNPGRSLYGIGAHYVSTVGFSGAAAFDMLNPNILLFDGDGPDAKFAGLSYVVADVPEGFTGDYDAWHSHPSACFEGGRVSSLTEENSAVWLSESECTARDGQVRPLENDQMMHLWIGPEYINRAPIFAHDHPDLYDGYNPKRDG